MAITLSPCNHERREIKEINENKIKLIKLTATSESHVIGPSAPCHRRHCSAPLLTHEVILVSPADVMPSSNRVVRMKGTNKIIATGTETFKRKSWVVCGSRVQRSLSRNVRAYPKLASDKSGRRVRFPTKKIKCKVAKFRQFIASKFLHWWTVKLCNFSASFHRFVQSFGQRWHTRVAFFSTGTCCQRTL